MINNHLTSLAFLTVQGCPPVEHVKAAAAAGYDAAGLRLIAPLGLELAHPIVGDKALIREIKTVASDLGLSFLDGEVFTLRPDTNVDSWLPVLETAAEFSMPLMQITSEDPQLARAADNLGRLADHSVQYGINIAIEFMRWRAAATIEDAARLAKASGRNNVGILLDALHLSRSGGDPADVAAIAPELLLYLQICDAPQVQPENNTGCIAEARADRMLPGQGGLWLADLLAALPGDIAISVETPHKGDVGLTFEERARNGIDATRAFLSRHDPVV